MIAGTRKGRASSGTPPGSFASGGSALKIPGGKLSWVSQLVRTRRPTRAGPPGDEHLAERAAGVVADQGYVLEVEGGEEVLMIVASPGGVRSASGFIATVCAPIGQSGAMQR